MSATVVVSNLRKRYGAVTAVDGVSFEIRSGEIFGLIGPNGAGKTTTVECLVGLRQPDEGRIEICGLDARRRPREVKQRIGAALQTTALQDRITPREALDLFGAFYGNLVPSDDVNLAGVAPAGPVAWPRARDDPGASNDEQSGTSGEGGAVAKERGRSVIASNRKARHDYHIEDVFEAGLALTGTEVKALRMGRASLVDGFAHFSGNELWLEGVHIPEYLNGTWTNHAPRRRRKLLLHREELEKIATKTRERGRTVVPLQLYFKDGRAKVEIALATGKREYDKRQSLRERQDRREADRAIGHRENR